MNVRDLAEPALEPVSLTQAKLFLRVDHDEEDGLILDMIKTARLQVEAFCGVSLISRLRRFTWSGADADNIIINHYPITTVQTVRLIDKSGGETVIAAEDYSVNLRARPARLSLNPPGAIKPDQQVELDAEAGYGQTADDIPVPFTQSIMLLTAQLYERGDERPENIPLMVQALLMPYRGLRL